VTGLRPASSDPYSYTGVKEIASSPDSMMCRPASVRSAIISPLLSVFLVSELILRGAPARGVSRTVSRKVIGAAGSVGVAVGVMVGVWVRVAVAVAV
jgi:hypothetical protein